MLRHTKRQVISQSLTTCVVLSRLDFRRSLVSGSGDERGLLSRTAAGNRAYVLSCL